MRKTWCEAARSNKLLILLSALALASLGNYREADDGGLCSFLAEEALKQRLVASPRAWLEVAPGQTSETLTISLAPPSPANWSLDVGFQDWFTAAFIGTTEGTDTVQVRVKGLRLQEFINSVHDPSLKVTAHSPQGNRIGDKYIRIKKLRPFIDTDDGSAETAVLNAPPTFVFNGTSRVVTYLVKDAGEQEFAFESPEILEKPPRLRFEIRQQSPNLLRVSYEVDPATPPPADCPSSPCRDFVTLEVEATAGDTRIFRGFVIGVVY